MSYGLSYLKKEIEAFVCAFFEDYKHQRVNSAKAIHDTVLGTNYFQPYEIAFLDLPIVQRLRRISQTDVASFVFPSGNHNRFEHTLGVAAIAGKFVDAINRRNNPLLINSGIEKDYIFRHSRIAAILHDVGHGPFSHLSEQIYTALLGEIKNIERFRGASPHEILSYLIATSDRLQEFNRDIIKGMYGVDIDLSLVGDMIIGFSEDKPEKVFMVEIINGAFDADKLDYMLRDAHSTGISATLDSSRLFHTMDVVKKDGKIRLCVDITGVIALEQIVFNKMTLFTTVYHHHKVRATGCLLKTMLCQNDNLKFPHNYLYYTDDDIWADKCTQNRLILKHLKNRYLPKRALVISSRTIKNGIEHLSEIMNLADDIDDGTDYITRIENYIISEVSRLYSVDLNDQIWIDIPKPPRFKEATTCIINNFSKTTKLTEIFPIDEWVKAFSENKWNAFVFAMPEHCEIVSNVAKGVFEELFDIEFNEYAQSICKLPSTMGN